MAKGSGDVRRISGFVECLVPRVLGWLSFDIRVLDLSSNIDFIETLCCHVGEDVYSWLLILGIFCRGVPAHG